MKIIYKNQICTCDELCNICRTEGEIDVIVIYDNGAVAYKKRNYYFIVNRLNKAILKHFKNHSGAYYIYSKYLPTVTFTTLVDTAATDNIRVFINPEFAYELTEKLGGKLKEKAREFKAKNGKLDNDDALNLTLDESYTYVLYVIIHECFHQVYNHIKMASVKLGHKPNKPEHDLCNISMDMEINRDIEALYEEFQGATEACGGCMDDKPSLKRTWWMIYQDLEKNGLPKKSGNNPFNQENDEDSVEHKNAPDDYAKGWNDAIADVKAGRIDPTTFNPLVVDPNNLSDGAPAYNYIYENVNGVQNVDDYNKGYNDAIQQILQKMSQPKGGTPAPKTEEWDNLDNIPNLNNDSDDDLDGIGSDGDDSNSDDNSQNGKSKSSKQKQQQNTQNNQQNGEDGSDGENSEGNDDNSDNQNGTGGTPGPENDNVTPPIVEPGTPGGGQNGGTTPGTPGQSKPGQGRSGKSEAQKREEAEAISNQAVKSSIIQELEDKGFTTGTDILTKELGRAIAEAENQPYEPTEEREDPDKRNRKLIEVIKDELAKREAGKNLGIREKLDEIEELLKAKSLVNWRTVLKDVFKNISPKYYKEEKLNNARRSYDHPGAMIKVRDRKYEEHVRNATDVFYLIDASGSMTNADLARALVEVFAVEKSKNLNIPNSAGTYFSTKVFPERIRKWNNETPLKKIKTMMMYDSSKDPSGGTAITDSILWVVKKAGKKYYSKSDPATTIIVFTDGEEFGNEYKKIQALPSGIRKRIVFIVVNRTQRLKEICAALLQNGIMSKHIVPISVDTL